jgi:hypothetical protein
MSDAFEQYIIPGRRKPYFAYGEKFCDNCRIVYAPFYPEPTCYKCGATLRTAPTRKTAERTVPEELREIERQYGPGYFFVRQRPPRAYLKYCTKCELVHPYSHPGWRCIRCNQTLADLAPRPPPRYVDAEVDRIE